jgi:predicted ATPase
VALDPLHEPAQRVLMETYAEAGQRAAALRQYDECVGILAEELGLSPSEETTALHERIRLGAPERAGVAAAAPRAHHNLPVQLIPFVGREAMLREIAERLLDPACRLLTLVGPGGSGKTRLALEAAAPQLDRFEDGVFFVPLAAVQSIEGIAPTTAQALGLSFHREGDPEQQLLAYLRGKRMLMILDNLEHLLPGPDPDRGNGSELVTAILEAAPKVKVLVTSRAALRVRAENLFPVTGMAYPERTTGGEAEAAREDPTAYSALRLFVQSARRVVPDFDLGSDNLPEVIGICRLVAGMPLGILLASAWVRMLSPGEIAAQLKTGLDLLETDLHDVPERQRSMRAVFDHSWGLLTEGQRAVMQALSVFRRGFTLEAAGAVAGASLRDLLSLLDRSLVEPGDGGRYQIHELLRQYAADRLRRAHKLCRAEKLDQPPGAYKAAKDRHAAYYAAALEKWGEELKGPRQREVWPEMDVEIDNARAAWDWAAEQGDVDLLSQAMEGLGRFYERRSRYREGEAAFRRAVGRLQAAGVLEPGAPANTLSALAKMLGFEAHSAYELGRSEIARDLLQRALSLLERPELCGRDTRSEEAFLWYVLGMAERQMGREEFRQSLERSLALARSVADQWQAARTLGEFADVDWCAGDYREARRKHEACLAIGQDLGDASGIAGSTVWLGWIHVLEGQVEEAQRLACQSLSIFRELGDPPGVTTGLLVLAEALAYAGKYPESQSVLEELHEIWTGLGISDALGLAILGWVELQQGKYGRARADLATAVKMTQEGAGFLALPLARLESGRIAVRDGAHAEARRLLRESIAGLQAVRLRELAARAWPACSYVACGLGDMEGARSDLVQALEWAADRGSYPVLVHALPAAAFLLLHQGETERAVEIYELACTHPYVANSQWHADVVGQPIAEAATALPPAVVAAARERGRARDTQATLKELIAEWED